MGPIPIIVWVSRDLQLGNCHYSRYGWKVHEARRERKGNQVDKTREERGWEQNTGLAELSKASFLQKVLESQLHHWGMVIGAAFLLL